VREISSFGEIIEAVSESAAYSHNAVVVVEEKIIGSEYSLDSLIFNDCFHPMGIARRYIDYPPYFIERGHSFPSDLSAEQERDMFEALKRAAEALGITTGAAKGDIFFTDRGPVIGEIAARLSGGFMSGWTFPLHSGIHPAIGAILAALGENLPPHMAAAPLQLHPVSERGIVSVPGVIRSIHHTASARADSEHIDSEHIDSERADSPYCFMSAQEGDTVNFPTNNVEKCGNVICRSSPEKGEEAVAGCFLPLRMEGEKKFRELLLANFPPAYPGIMKKLQNRRMRLHGTLSAAELPIPDFILNSDEKDWNYRTIPQSLEAIRYFRPHFSWRCRNAIQNASRNASRNASKTDPYGTWTTAQLNFLTALLKGGFQTALYYIELEQKLTEKKISPYWKLLH
ncbi:MAG: ATP-grasp domain-containing protein, partial [Salinispira sp.]